MKRFLRVLVAGLIGGGLAALGVLSDALSNGIGAEKCAIDPITGTSEAICYLGQTQATWFTAVVFFGLAALTYWRAYVSPPPPK